MPLEDIEKKLYGMPDNDRKEENEEEDPEAKPVTTRRQAGVPEKWGKFESGNKYYDVDDVVAMAERFPVKKIIFWGIIWIVIAAILIAGYFLYQAFTSSGVSVGINNDEPVLSGVPFNVNINYSNNSPSVLNGATLTLTLPPEFSFVGGDIASRVHTEDIGTVGVGIIGQQAMQITALRGEGTCADIIATLDYKAAGGGSGFEKSFTKSVCVGASAIALNILGANQVFSNETFEIKVNYKNISSATLQNLELQLEYPQNYTFQNASLKPDQGDNIWELGDLRPGSSNEIAVQGSVIAQADSFFEIKVKLISKSNSTQYVVAGKSISISVSQPPLSIAIAVQSGRDYIAKPGDSINYTLQFKNNTDVGFRDVVITARLTGEMFDLSSIDRTIDFDQATQTLTWNKASLADLGLLSPGASGTVNFKVMVSKNFPIIKLSDKNFTLKIDAQIDSPTVPSYVSADRTVSIDSLTTKIAGQITVDSKGLFRDAASGILNSGPIPPRVNMKTDYTIHWVVKNYSTDVSNVELRAFLKPGVRATGVIKSNIETSPVYNDRTQEMVWDIPKIQATRGVISDPAEAIFQIEALPSVNQVNGNMPLLGETNITALDLFTNLNLNYTAGEINTSLNGNDPTLKFGDAKVLP